MGSLSIWHWLIVLLVVVAVVGFTKEAPVIWAAIWVRTWEGFKEEHEIS